MKPKLRIDNNYRFFLKFLKDNGAHDAFMRNVDNLGCTPEVSYFLINSFDWDKSKEGLDYWSSLHELWFEKLNEL